MSRFQAIAGRDQYSLGQEAKYKTAGDNTFYLVQQKDEFIIPMVRLLGFFYKEKINAAL